MANSDEIDGKVEKELHKREKELQKSKEHENFLLNLIENSTQPFNVMCADGQLQMINKAFEELTHYTFDELKSTHWIETLTPPDFRDMEREKLEELQRTGKPVRYEKEYVRKNGTRVPVELFVHYVKNENGTPRYYYSFITDISEKKKSEEKTRELVEQLQNSNEELKVTNDELQSSTEDLRVSNEYLESSAIELKLANEKLNNQSEELIKINRLLSESEKKYRMLFESMTEAFIFGGIILDRYGKPYDWKYLAVNRAAAAAYALEPEQLINKRFREVFPKLEPPYLKEIGQVAVTGIPLKNMEIYNSISKNYFEIDIYSQEKGFFAVFTRNITQRKNTEKELQATLADLKRSNRELEQFAYVASHDLQEPLRMVSSFTQLLEMKYKDVLDAEALEYINFAVDGAKRMQLLINDLLAYSRVNTKGGKFENIDLEKALDDALFNLEIVIEENKATITWDPLPKICADYWQMVQLFQNLIGNAIKYRSQETPQIFISTRKEDNHWLFSVEDNGIGIDPKFREQIFRIFKRLHTPDEYKGTGIGLAIAERIIIRHGGRIWVKSELGKGSKFYFTIPLK